MSPSLVYFSRTARPYALIALFGFIAIVAFRWHARRGSARVGGRSIVLATVAGRRGCTCCTIVFTLWPFAYFGVRRVARCGTRAVTRASLRAHAGALFALGFADRVAVGAAYWARRLLNDWRAMAGKAGADSVTARSCIARC